MRHYREVRCEDRLPMRRKQYYVKTKGPALPLQRVYFYDPENEEIRAYWKLGVKSFLEEYDPEAEARERYEKANKFLSHETYMNGEFNRIDMAIKIASGLMK